MRPSTGDEAQKCLRIRAFLSIPVINLDAPLTSPAHLYHQPRRSPLPYLPLLLNSLPDQPQSEGETGQGIVPTATTLPRLIQTSLSATPSPRSASWSVRRKGIN
ncbi:hypothetical protein E2C01_012583 [Portunus trituberculatus]|uniref:Uncharacterized protein n=1 Tax=Portunus trituberculatus TaxID=210409 RepID=A0A5B7DEE0_PORTR|nr:hypothetical protein [Portunus trituberculatus]